MFNHCPNISMQYPRIYITPKQHRFRFRKNTGLWPHSAYSFLLYANTCTIKNVAFNKKGIPLAKPKVDFSIYQTVYLAQANVVSSRNSANKKVFFRFQSQKYRVYVEFREWNQNLLPEILFISTILHIHVHLFL